jgi:hypothetical protein
VVLLGLSQAAAADCPWKGTWVKRGVALTLIADESGPGCKLSHRMMVDARHWTSVMKYDGKPTATGKTELSADGKVMTTELDVAVASPNSPIGKQVEVWDKQK